jgi:hypothetical protein
VIPVLCEVCGRRLRDPASAARRVGPVCERRTRPQPTPAGPVRSATPAALEGEGQLTIEEEQHAQH